MCLLGKIVFYTLTESDAKAVNRRRHDAQLCMQIHRIEADGSQIHVGNIAKAGDVLPMIVTAHACDYESQMSSDFVSGQVFLNGNDSLWVDHAGPGSYSLTDPRAAPRPVRCECGCGSLTEPSGPAYPKPEEF